MPTDIGSSPSEKQVTAGRAGIIEAVKTPLGFYSLVVLVVEAILAAIAGISEGFDRTLTIACMMVVIIGLILIVAYFSVRHPGALLGKEKQVDVGPQLAPLKAEIQHLTQQSEEFKIETERLRKETETLRQEMERRTSLESRVWSVLDRGESASVKEIVKTLGLAAREDVDSIIGRLLREGLIEPDNGKPYGSYQPTEGFRKSRSLGETLRGSG